MMGGNIYRDADNLDVPVANTMTLRLMKQYHGDAIREPLAGQAFYRILYR